MLTAALTNPLANEADDGRPGQCGGLGAPPTRRRSNYRRTR